MSTESVIRSPKALQRTKNMHQLIAVRMQLDFRRPVAKRTFRIGGQRPAQPSKWPTTGSRIHL